VIDADKIRWPNEITGHVAAWLSNNIVYSDQATNLVRVHRRRLGQGTRSIVVASLARDLRGFFVAVQTASYLSAGRQDSIQKHILDCAVGCVVWYPIAESFLDVATAEP
jgi:hypothetical protein